MSYFNKNKKLSDESTLLFRATIKENIFLLIVFGWSGWALILPSLFDTLRSRDNSWTWILISLGSISFCIVNGYENFYSKFIITISIVALAIFVDCYNKTFIHNIIIHLVNGVHIGVSIYFLIMKLYPENFPPLWRTILPSGNEAFDMLILCLVFQNVGYYMIGSWLSPQDGSIARWANSPMNLVNLNFIHTDRDRLKLFYILSSFGLMGRIWNLSLGKVYYTEGSGVPFYISSFLAQFDRLYVTAWLYGCWFWLQKNIRTNSIVWPTVILTIVELIYQIFSGSKGRFFNFIVIPLATVFILTRQRVSAITVLLLAGFGVISWLFIYPILVVYRNVISANPLGNIVDPIASINKAYQLLNSYSSEQYIEIILTPFNASGITEQVMAMTSIIHYHLAQDGDLLWPRLLLFWIPRFLWDEKPIALSANLIGRLSHRLPDFDITTSVLITGTGELYLYYGLLGSTLMVLVGIVFRWINEAISPFKLYTPFRIAVLISFLPLMQGFVSGTFESGLTGLVIQLGVLYLILGFVKRLM
jgi:hypothetical protein